jgi:hypothetical protein
MLKNNDPGCIVDRRKVTAITKIIWTEAAETTTASDECLLNLLRYRHVNNRFNHSGIGGVSTTSPDGVVYQPDHKAASILQRAITFDLPIRAEETAATHIGDCRPISLYHKTAAQQTFAFHFRGAFWKLEIPTAG